MALCCQTQREEVGLREKVTEDESGLTGRVRATEAHVQKFESLNLLLGVDSREPLKVYEHGSDSVRFVVGMSRAVGPRLTPCSAVSLLKGRELFHIFSVSPAPLCLTCSSCELRMV